MKALLFFLFILCTPSFSTLGQSSAPSSLLVLGSSKAAVEKAYGPPFQHWNMKASEDSVKIGAPVGIWDVYHLTTHEDRMYVTMIHFGPPGKKTKDDSGAVINSLVLELNDHWTVNQVMTDQPEFAAICAKTCDVVRVQKPSGSTSLMLAPKGMSPVSTILYFDGDSGTIQWRSVSSMESAVSWAYAVRLENFDSRNPGVRKEVIGSWSPNGNGQP